MYRYSLLGTYRNSDDSHFLDLNGVLLILFGYVGYKVMVTLTIYPNPQALADPLIILSC